MAIIEQRSNYVQSFIGGGFATDDPALSESAGESFNGIKIESVALSTCASIGRQLSMNVVIAGGSGQVGTILARAFDAQGLDVAVLSRSLQSTSWRTVHWDARTLGPWASEIDDADVVINLAGRNVNCRYNDANRKAIMDSRVESTRIIGQAIAAARHPPRLWLQASTATIYAHRFDAPNDDVTGQIGGTEPDAPASWKFSIDVAQAWERAADEIVLPHTRIVKMRSSMIMSPDRGGIFDTLLTLVKRGLGGSAAGGRQYVSWIHETDFVGAVGWLIEHEELVGPINIAAPNPLPYHDFMKAIRDAAGVHIALPATKLMLEVGAFLMRTETELVLKSRRVIPKRLSDSGFNFMFPEWAPAAKELVHRSASRGI